jgi:hypothetical protein
MFMEQFSLRLSAHKAGSAAHRSPRKEKKMKKAVWISFDLGVNGDYEGMYAWLDTHHAKECGDSIAFLGYEPKRDSVLGEPTRDLISELKADLKRSVSIKKKNRVYVIYKSDEGKLKGVFLFGGRKKSPWTGYGASEEMESSDEL